MSTTVEVRIRTERGEFKYPVKAVGRLIKRVRVEDGGKVVVKLPVWATKDPWRYVYSKMTTSEIDQRVIVELSL